MDRPLYCKVAPQNSWRANAKDHFWQCPFICKSPFGNSAQSLEGGQPGKLCCHYLVSTCPLAARCRRWSSSSNGLLVESAADDQSRPGGREERTWRNSTVNPNGHVEIPENCSSDSYWTAIVHLLSAAQSPNNHPILVTSILLINKLPPGNKIHVLKGYDPFHGWFTVFLLSSDDPGGQQAGLLVSAGRSGQLLHSNHATPIQVPLAHDFLPLKLARAVGERAPKGMRHMQHVLTNNVEHQTNEPEERIKQAVFCSLYNIVCCCSLGISWRAKHDFSLMPSDW